ncbi:MAG: acetylornithine deacetylase [Alphaproteobacteria bacterium]|nr:acetylornithine deacetylase [Alphaproteobacteria bacterium]
MQAAYSSIEMLAKLVAFDTTSRDSNLALIHWVRAYLAEQGVEAVLVHDASGRKANLFATVGPKDRGGIVLSGHTDVVPVDGQAWSSDPFALARRDLRLFGRGTTDMKGFVAVALAQLPRMVKAPLKTPIHFALSYDEEVGCLGVRRLLAEIASWPEAVRPKACIVGEPTEMKVIVAHKGKRSWRVRFKGRACHSSIPHHGVNAVEAAAEFIALLNRLGRKLAKDGPFDRAFDPPATTVHTGVIHGGTALNIVPEACELLCEVRHIPGQDPDALFAGVLDQARRDIEPAMKAVDPAAGITVELMSGFPGLATRENDAVTELARACAGANAVGKVAFGCEGGLFQDAGIPTVVCGPGSIDQAHTTDEFIAESQLAACEAFIIRLVEKLST